MKIESLCKPVDDFTFRELVWLICSPQLAASAWGRKYILAWFKSQNGWHHPLAVAGKYTWWNRVFKKFAHVNHGHLRFYREMLWAIETCSGRYITTILYWPEGRVLDYIEKGLLHIARDLSLDQKAKRNLEEKKSIQSDIEVEIDRLSSKIKDTRETIMAIHSVLRYTKMVKSDVAYYFHKVEEEERIKRTPAELEEEYDMLKAQHEEANRPEVVDARIVTSKDSSEVAPSEGDTEDQVADWKSSADQWSL